jgi:hypothetical protein
MKISVTMEDDIAARAQAVAQEENISISDVIERSVVFLDLVPQEFRDLVVELRADDDEAGLQYLQEGLLSLVRKSRAGMAVR